MACVDLPRDNRNMCRCSLGQKHVHKQTQSMTFQSRGPLPPYAVEGALVLELAIVQVPLSRCTVALPEQARRFRHSDSVHIDSCDHLEVPYNILLQREK